MSTDNCTITTSSSNLSYNTTGNAYDEIEIYNISDDLIYNVPLPKCKHIATETSTTIFTASTIGAVQNRKVLRVLFDSGATKTMLKRSVLPRGVVKTRKLNKNTVKGTNTCLFFDKLHW